MKKKLYISGAVLAAVLLAGALNLSGKLFAAKNADPSILPIARMHAFYAYDVNDIYKRVGMSDYVFVGTVISNDGTRYDPIVYLEDEFGLPTKKVGKPYTDYTIEIMYNIKGELKTGMPLPAVKNGGVMIDNSSVELYENDELPEVGKIYIFRAFAAQDGSILISGPNSNVALSEEEAKNIPASGKYQEYVTAYEEEIIPVERERFSSVYEKEAG